MYGNKIFHINLQLNINDFRTPITTPAYGQKNLEEQQKVRSTLFEFNSCLLALATEVLKS